MIPPLPSGVQHVVLRRDSPHDLWGFRLVGGAEHSKPLQIQRVTLGSASDGELQRGDTVLRLDGQDTANMTHQEAHDIISNSVNELQMTVNRPLEPFTPPSSVPHLMFPIEEAFRCQQEDERQQQEQEEQLLQQQLRETLEQEQLLQQQQEEESRPNLREKRRIPLLWQQWTFVRIYLEDFVCRRAFCLSHDASDAVFPYSEVKLLLHDCLRKVQRQELSIWQPCLNRQRPLKRRQQKNNAPLPYYVARVLARLSTRGYREERRILQHLTPVGACVGRKGRQRANTNNTHEL
ncbi:unnamed protein product [Cyprideis torosa]|uniref:Uncharacterized protein n=1 Tax=Cyprideis torosa TaxID=163714 RepID=A0A7R8W231_9CRUS|nr:unnamed protein product [Cyprideis torosa]CAG0880537.1 unnamed protein product [Cyprideis torosa]